MRKRIGVSLGESTNMLSKDFKNERELCDYIELNIEKFCETELDCKLYYYKREWSVDNKVRPGCYKRAVDFFIQGDNGKTFIIECKHNSAGASEAAKAIGQVLGYKLEIETNGMIVHQCIIVGTRVCHLTDALIMQYNLPIVTLFMDKKISLRSVEKFD